MRKEAQTRQNVTLAGVQGYHSGGNLNPESYAFAGFDGNWYFNSDRAIALDSNYNRVDGQPLQGYGLEIETESHNGIENDRVLAEVITKIIFPSFKFGKKMFKLQRDGSLGGQASCEIITQVMTKGRIRNDYAAYKTMYDTYFPCFGLTADSRQTNCGMHVNVSRACFGKTKEAQDEAIRKLYYVVNRYHRLFAKAFYRNPDNTYWCEQMTKRHLEYEEGSETMAERFAWQNAKNINFGWNRFPSSHRNCINLSHYDAGRIEIRLVGGQGSYVNFRNTMEVVFHVVETIGKRSWDDLDDLAKIFKGCNQYVTKRLADCVGLDGFTMAQFNRILDSVKSEDLELRNV